jgi:ADP-ribose pyrophosphatase YjhB (NUDIX family)
VLLDDADQVLLLRHRFHDSRAWGMPGGWLSPGEDIFACWRREIREELALDAEVEGIICHRSTRRTLEFYLLGRISGGQLKIDPLEILEARFFAAEDLPPMERFCASVIGRALGSRLGVGAVGTSGNSSARLAGETVGMAAQDLGQEGLQSPSGMQDRQRRE